MRDFKASFKRFGGDHIPDIIEYIKEYVSIEPGTTISVGCDSIQRRKRTIYACTIMLHNRDIRNGAHVVFFRESHDKIRDNFERLYKEAQYCFDISEFLNNELSSFYKRGDLSIEERKRYKYHILNCNNEYNYIPLHQQEIFVKNLNLSEFESDNEYKLVDIHVDFNPYESTINGRGMTRNKSNMAYNAYVPWLRSSNYRVWCKPSAWASTSAADLLLQN